MANTKLGFPDVMIAEEEYNYEAVKELIFSKEFFDIVEKFCNKISLENNKYNLFLNKYFNNDGYVDVWEIPHVLFEIYTSQFDYRSELLTDVNFTNDFTPFIGLFYDFCLKEYNVYPIGEINSNNIHSDITKLKIGRNTMNILVEMCGTVLSNLDKNIKLVKNAV